MYKKIRRPSRHQTPKEEPTSPSAESSAQELDSEILAGLVFELGEENKLLQKANTFNAGQLAALERLLKQARGDLMDANRQLGYVRAERDELGNKLWDARHPEPAPEPKSPWGKIGYAFVILVLLLFCCGLFVLPALFPCPNFENTGGEWNYHVLASRESGSIEFLRTARQVVFSWGNCGLVEAPQTEESVNEPSTVAEQAPADGMSVAAEEPEVTSTPVPGEPEFVQVRTATAESTAQPTGQAEEEIASSVESVVDDGVHGLQLYRFVEVDIPDEGGIDFVGQSSDRPQVERRDLGVDCWIRGLSANSHIVIQRLSFDGGSQLDWGGPFPVSETGKLCLRRGPGGVYYFESDPVGPKFDDAAYNRIVAKSRKLQMVLCKDGWTVCSNDLAKELVSQGIPAPNYEWRSEGVKGLERIVAVSDDNQVLVQLDPRHVYTIHGCVQSACSLLATYEYGDWVNNVWFHGSILEEPDQGQITVIGDSGGDWDRYQVVQRTVWKGFDARRVLAGYQGQPIEHTDFDVPMFYLGQDYRPVIIAGHIVDGRSDKEKAALYDGLPVVK